MREECAARHGTGQITCGIPQGELALKTIHYVRDQLSAWRDDPSRPSEESENKLNAQLCKFLDSRARNEFPMIRFDREERQFGRREADLSASPSRPMPLEAKPYSIYEPILIIECKRLPAPSRKREKEYVTGGEDRNGGIQRFKLGLYAAEHELAALVGYVQNNTTSHWHEEINNWISDLAAATHADGCVWHEDEKLGQLQEHAPRDLATSLSSHSRIGNVSSQEIEIHHLWISMAPASLSRLSNDRTGAKGSDSD